jgi:hypothetical protein
MDELFLGLEPPDIPDNFPPKLFEDTIEINLWRHLEGLIKQEDWDKVAAGATRYLEESLGSWCAISRDKNGRLLTGTRLVEATIGVKGSFRLGNQENEHQGWQQLASGLFKAVRNVDAHQLQQRTDTRYYAIGVVGTVSLILTQLKSRHRAKLVLPRNRPRIGTRFGPFFDGDLPPQGWR